MKFFALCLIFFSSLFALPRVPVSQVTRLNNGFALALYTEIIKSQPRSNVLFAPYGISAAMAIAYLGAKEGTAKEIGDALFYPLDPNYMGESFKRIDQDFSTDKKLGMTHSLWVPSNLTIKEEYLERVNKYFADRFHQLDFDLKNDSSRNEINAWVAGKTAKKIPALLSVSDLPRSTRMLLLTSVTLQAPWESPFSLKDTVSESFYVAPDRPRPVSMMQAQGEYPFYETEEVRVLEIPFLQNEGEVTRLGFWIVLPRGSLDLKQVEEALSIDKFTEWRTQAVRKPIFLKLPRFRFNQIYNFKELLEKMGLKVSFTPEANFSNMTDSPQAMITKIFQKTTLLINERGVDAPLKPLLKPPPLSSKEGIQDFIANRPFLFFILDDSLGQLLFLGRYMTP